MQNCLDNFAFPFDVFLYEKINDKKLNEMTFNMILGIIFWLNHPFYIEATQI